jgi:hypothetical protein
MRVPNPSGLSALVNQNLKRVHDLTQLSPVTLFPEHRRFHLGCRRVVLVDVHHRTKNPAGEDRLVKILRYWRGRRSAGPPPRKPGGGKESTLGRRTPRKCGCHALVHPLSAVAVPGPAGSVATMHGTLAIPHGRIGRALSGARFRNIEPSNADRPPIRARELRRLHGKVGRRRRRWKYAVLRTGVRMRHAAEAVSRPTRCRPWRFSVGPRPGESATSVTAPRRHARRPRTHQGRPAPGTVGAVDPGNDAVLAPVRPATAALPVR